jgi:hypothetical protein
MNVIRVYYLIFLYLTVLYQLHWLHNIKCDNANVAVEWSTLLHRVLQQLN